MRRLAARLVGGEEKKARTGLRKWLG